MHTVQLDFQDAKTKHLQFKSRLRSVLFGEILEDENPVVSHTECPVGKWIYQHALKTYIDLPELIELEKVHERIHSVARELLNFYKNGKIEEARSGLDKMESVAEELILLLHKVESKISVNKTEEKASEDLNTLSEMYQKNELLYAKIKLQSDEFLKQQEFYKNLLVASPVILWVSDEKANITYMSPTWYKWTGLNEEEEINDSWIETMHEADRENVLKVFENNFELRTVFEVEYRMNLNQNTIWCLANGQPSFDSSDNFVGYVGSIIDISERKKAGEDLNKKREDERKMLHDFFMEAPAIFCIVRGPYHVFEMANPLYTELVGNREIIGKPVRDAFPELEGQGYFELLDEVYKNKHQFVGKELPFSIDKGKGLELIFVTFIYQAITNNLNQSEGILIYATDVTEQVNARNILQKSEENFKHLANMSPQIIWTARPDGYVDYYNKRWYEYGGLENIFGDESWETMIHPQDIEKAKVAWNTALKNGKEYTIEYRLKNKQGNSYRWFLGQSLPVKSESGEITQWFGTCTDIHDQKNFTKDLERKVAQRTQQLISLNIDLKRSNDELSQFAYIASHDLQEPLRKVITFANRVSDEYKDTLPEGSQNYLSKINSSAKRMSMLINDLLEFSGTDKNNKEFVQIDINDVVRELLVDFEEEIDRKNATFSVDNLPVIPAIPLQMTQLFHNLISNALKFSKKDIPPHITISATEMTFEQKEYYHIPDKNKHFIQIAFRDNGIGFDEIFSDKIFTIFQRLHSKSAYEGTGIGLALCKKIAENHGGNIIAASTEKVGSSFFINLPFKKV